MRAGEVNYRLAAQPLTLGSPYGGAGTAEGGD